MTSIRRNANIVRNIVISLAQSARTSDWSQIKTVSSWNSFAKILTQHKPGKKDGLCYVVGHLSGGKRGSKNIEDISLCVLDVDSGHSLDEVASPLKERGLAAAIASTHSHLTSTRIVSVGAWEAFEGKYPDASPEKFLVESCGVLGRIAEGATWDGPVFTEVREGREVQLRKIRHRECPRFRIVMPLAKPIRKADFQQSADFLTHWRERVEAVTHELGLQADPCSKKPCQPFYFPRYPKDGPKPEALILDGLALDIDALPVAPVSEKPLPAKSAASHGRKSEVTVISVFNRLFSVHEILVENGYEPADGRYIAPGSSTGVPGVVVLEDGKVFSHHTNDPLANGHSHDAFSLFQTLEHGGDFESAYQAAVELIEDRAIDQINEMHAFITFGGKPFVIDERQDTYVFSPLTLAAFDAIYKNFLVPQSVRDRGKQKIKFVSASKFWMEHPRRRAFVTADFAPPPLQMKSSVYNLFKGFSVAPAQTDNPDAWSLYRAHVENVVLGGDPELIKYFWAWCADMIQHPGSGKPGVAIAFRGGRGVGKGTVTAPLLRITAPHSLQINNRERLTGRFNSHLADKILLVADEAHWSGDHGAAAVLKGLITEATLDVEGKGRDAIAIRNFTRIMMTSNERWVCPAGRDERRYLVIDVPGDHAQDHEYFGAIHDQMETGGDAALLKFLLGYDLSGINLRKAPNTKALLDQKLESLSTVERFWFDCLSKGRIGGGGCTISSFSDAANDELTDDSEEEGWPERITTEALFSDYRHEVKASRKWEETQTAFITTLFHGGSSLCPDAEKKRLSLPGRPRGYKLPNLARCRELFEIAIKDKISWDD